MSGKLIVIEGTDSSGKETQSKLLVKKLKDMGYKAINLSFPMYDSPTGKIVGGSLLGKKEIGKSFFKEGVSQVDPKVAALYYAADRKYNIGIIKRYIDDDYYVILDRYISSNMAHQGCKIIDKDERFNTFQWIDRLEYWLLELPKPDLTILLHVPFNISRELAKSKEFIDEYEQNDEYLNNALNTYLELSELYNWRRINCVKDDKLKSIEDINGEIIKIVLGDKYGKYNN